MTRVLALAVCVLVLLVSSASSQSYSNNRAQTISNIFQIPIQTLTAISNFAQNTRPLGEIIQRRRNPQVQQIYPPSSGQSAPIISYPRSNAAKIAGLYIASDGSARKLRRLPARLATKWDQLLEYKEQGTQARKNK